jgi:hypothetical protein
MSRAPDLPERFASLRRDETARVPGFDQVLHRNRPRSIRFAGLFAIAATAVVTVVAVVAATVFEISRTRGPRAIDGSALTLADWRAPTDFLLDTPGRELLRAVPAVGAYPAHPLVPLPKIHDTTPARNAAREPT